MVQKHVFPNGLTLVFEKREFFAGLSAAVWVRAGSVHDGAHKAGLAHFVEHMLFRGTTTRSALQIVSEIESLGGDVNAFTERELTCYHATVFHQHLPTALSVLADLVTHPTINVGDIEQEKQVLLQEIASVNDDPEDSVHQMLFEACYGKQPIGRSILGTERSVQTIGQDDIRSFLDDYYQPENMIVSVAGDVDFAKVTELVQETFQFQPKQRTLPFHTAAQPRFWSHRRTASSKVDQAHLAIAFKGIGYDSEMRYVQLLLASHLGLGMSSRLFQQIRERLGLVYSIDCDSVCFWHTGLVTIYCGFNPKDLKKLLAALKSELRRVMNEPIEEALLDRLKQQVEGHVRLSRDNVEVSQESAGRNELYFGRHISVDEACEAIRRVTAEQIQQFAKKIFRKNCQSSALISDKKVQTRAVTLF